MKLNTYAIYSSLITVCLLSGASSFADNTPTKMTSEVTKELRAKALAEVLNQSKKADSVIGKVLAKVTADTTDGRNANGCLPSTIKATDLSSFVISAEDVYAASVSSQTGLGELSTTADFLVSISCVTGVHRATEVSPITFKVSMSKIVQIKRDLEGQAPDKILSTEINADLKQVDLSSI